MFYCNVLLNIISVTIIILMFFRYCIRDESEREDISKWIQPDSGYEDPSCWRTASS